MSFTLTSWLKNIAANLRGKSPTKRRSAVRNFRSTRLVVESLEDRLLLSALTTLASFDYANGGYPMSTLQADSSGNLFGTTPSGGAFERGTVFKLAAGSGAITTLASFNGANGSNPQSGVVADSSGNLFGTTAYGGAFGYGTVFELEAGTGTITTLASFDNANGAFPNFGTLVLDSSGNLFGATQSGGASGMGTVFEVAAGSEAITTLVSFNGVNGAYPFGGLVADGSGNLFGTTAGGGASDIGTVFKVAPSGVLTTLASFNGANGAQPWAGLVIDSSGNLFGTTSMGYGASSAGTLFKLTPGSDAITVLASFDNSTSGSFPRGDLVIDSSGNLFGTTSQYGSFLGSYGAGTLFELTAGSGAITVLAAFDHAATGFYPWGGLTIDSSGNLFGTTREGGASGWGTMFEFTFADPPKAISTTTTVGAGPFIYDGTIHSGGSGTVTGAGTVTGSATLTYSSNADGTGTADRINAGTYYVTAHYAGDDNHEASDGEAVAIVINKATLTGLATTQDALNIAEQGSLVFTLNNFTGLQNSETLASILSQMSFKLTIGANTYDFTPSFKFHAHSTLDASDDTVVVKYSLRNGGDGGLLAADLQALNVSDGIASTSASNASIQAIWVWMSSDNYSFSDDALTRLFSSAK